MKLHLKSLDDAAEMVDWTRKLMAGLLIASQAMGQSPSETRNCMYHGLTQPERIPNLGDHLPGTPGRPINFNTCELWPGLRGMNTVVFELPADGLNGRWKNDLGCNPPGPFIVRVLENIPLVECKAHVLYPDGSMTPIGNGADFRKNIDISWGLDSDGYSVMSIKPREVPACKTGMSICTASSAEQCRAPRATSPKDVAPPSALRFPPRIGKALGIGGVVLGSNRQVEEFIGDTLDWTYHQLPYGVQDGVEAVASNPWMQLAGGGMKIGDMLMYPLTGAIQTDFRSGSSWWTPYRDIEERIYLPMMRSDDAARKSDQDWRQQQIDARNFDSGQSCYQRMYW